MPVCQWLYYFYNILIKHCKGTMATATDEIIEYHWGVLGAKSIHWKFTGKAETVNIQVKFLIEVCFCKDNLRWLSSRNLSLAEGIVKSQNKSSNISCKCLAVYSFSRTQSFYTFFSLRPCCPRTRTRCLFLDMIFQDTVQSPALSSNDGSATLLQSPLSVSANGTRRFSSQQNIPQLKLSLVPSFHLI